MLSFIGTKKSETIFALPIFVNFVIAGRGCCPLGYVTITPILQLAIDLQKRIERWGDAVVICLLLIPKYPLQASD